MTASRLLEDRFQTTKRKTLYLLEGYPKTSSKLIKSYSRLIQEYFKTISRHFHNFSSRLQNREKGRVWGGGRSIPLVVNSLALEEFPFYAA